MKPCVFMLLLRVLEFIKSKLRTKVSINPNHEWHKGVDVKLHPTEKTSVIINPVPNVKLIAVSLTPIVLGYWDALLILYQCASIVGSSRRILKTFCRNHCHFTIPGYISRRYKWMPGLTNFSLRKTYYNSSDEMRARYQWVVLLILKLSDIMDILYHNHTFITIYSSIY